MFLASDCCPHKPLADGLHDLFGLSCASLSMEHSYSNICYWAVAAHGGVDIGANQYLTGWGCRVRSWGNRYRLFFWYRGLLYAYVVPPRGPSIRPFLVKFLSSLAWQRVAHLPSTVLLGKNSRADKERGFAESSRYPSAAGTVHSVWMTRCRLTHKNYIFFSAKAIATMYIFMPKTNEGLYIQVMRLCRRAIDFSGNTQHKSSNNIK